MIIADTSIWINHFRAKDLKFSKKLTEGKIIIHPFIIGELACGYMKNKKEILNLLKDLPKSKIAEDREVITLIDNYSLMGEGVGWIDLHLIASAMLSRAKLWTADKDLNKIANYLNCAYS